MAIDRLGGLDLTIVYCTLCGTVIPYESQIDGRRFTFGTSGLLYRSNKLMFDEETHSLWSSIDGTPVVGSLVGSGLRLSFQSAVTTTWGEWRRDDGAIYRDGLQARLWGRCRVSRVLRHRPRDVRGAGRGANRVYERGSVTFAKREATDVSSMIVAGLGTSRPMRW